MFNFFSYLRKTNYDRYKAEGARHQIKKYRLLNPDSINDTDEHVANKALANDDRLHHFLIGKKLKGKQLMRPAFINNTSDIMAVDLLPMVALGYAASSVDSTKTAAIVVRLQNLINEAEKTLDLHTQLSLSNYLRLLLLPVAGYEDFVGEPLIRVYRSLVSDESSNVPALNAANIQIVLDAFETFELDTLKSAILHQGALEGCKRDSTQ